MNLDLMMVLSMRQKEMAYQQSTRLTPMPPPLASAAAATNQYGLSVSTAFNYGVGVGTPLSPVTPGFSSVHATAKGRVGVGMPRGSISPLSVGGGAVLPLYANATTSGAYDQFGFTWHWIARVGAHFALQRQSAHLAIQYAHVLLRKRLLLSAHDAFVLGLNNAFDDDVFAMQRELQLLGMACVFMAAKIEEVHPPKATELAAFLSSHGTVKCTGDDLVRCESEYLKELNWNLHPTTPLSWLLFLLAGDSAEPPLDTMGDFVNPRHNLSGTKDLFVHAVRLLDIALLDAQAVDYLPSVLAGSALLLVDASLDFLFVAQFLQLDQSVLWECKTWLYGLVYSTNMSVGGSADTSKDRDRWLKVADEELLFIQTHLATPTHLAFGLLRTVVERPSLPSLYYNNSHSSNNNNSMHSSACSAHNSHQLLDCGCAFEHQQQQQQFASPSSSDNYGCLCKDGFHTCGGGSNNNNNAYDSISSSGPHVYHFKYGWQGVDGGLVYDAAQPQSVEPMRYM